MSYRCLYIRYSDKISVDKNNLIIKNNEKEIEIPLSDISMILIEDSKTVLTARFISSLAKNYIGMILCDEKYVPVSITLPLNMHYKQLEVLNKQLSVKKPLNSQLWQKIILAKLTNQRKLLELKTNNEYYIEQISKYIGEMKSNDKTNREALAAKAFFSGLYGEYFNRRRKSEDEINVALNYGYTVLAMAICRYLCMYGFNTIIGIHHASMSNNFNLAYDFLEPFRPVVDSFVFDNLDSLSFPLATDIKVGLIRLLTNKIRLNNKNYLIEHAMEEMVLSYIKSIDNNDASMLLLPELLDEI